MHIKEKIKERVNSINDPRLWDELLRAAELAYEIEHLEELSEAEKGAIDHGTSDANAGNPHSNSEGNEGVQKWQKNKMAQPIY